MFYTISSETFPYRKSREHLVGGLLQTTYAPFTKIPNPRKAMPELSEEVIYIGELLEMQSLKFNLRYASCHEPLTSGRRHMYDPQA